jgi:hypothetical protein
VRAVTLAVTPRALLLPGRPHLLRSPKRFPPSTARACTEREVGIEKTAPSGMEEGICTRGSRRKMRVGQPTHGPNAPKGAGWAIRWPGGNQSPPLFPSSCARKQKSLVPTLHMRVGTAAVVPMSHTSRCPARRGHWACTSSTQYMRMLAARGRKSGAVVLVCQFCLPATLI